MKCICIGRNYVDHIHELNNAVPDEPVIFLKPDTAVLQGNAPFYHPSFSKDIHHEIELIFRVCKEGKYIAPSFARDYVDKVGVGIDFTARDLQGRLKEKGLPWEKSKAFNGSAVLSSWLPLESTMPVADLSFYLQVNGTTRQEGNGGLMLHTLEQIIAHVSQYFTLKPGDVLFTGTPKGVGPVHVGDKLDGFLNGTKLLSFEVK
jgi:2-keto-4-pentenoate hydratase/2-oxohepta-3-ene-1,7-dioic acid hydratase in catechol pathway